MKVKPVFWKIYFKVSAEILPSMLSDIGNEYFRGKQLCRNRFGLPSKKGSTIKERTCSERSKFFPL